MDLVYTADGRVEALLLVLVLLASAEIGFQVAQRLPGRREEALGSYVTIVESALTGLLARIIREP